MGPLFCVFPLRFYQVIPLWKISSHWFGSSFLIRMMASSSVRLRTIQSISAYPASWQSFWRRWPAPSHRPHANRRWWAGPLTATLCCNFNGQLLKSQQETLPYSALQRLLFQRDLSTKRTFPSLIGLLYLKHIDRKRFSVYSALFRLLYVFLSVSVSFFSRSILRRIFRQIV